MQIRTRKRANDLDGKTWTRYSVSVWNDIRKNEEELRLGHPAIFPTQLVSRLIECFLPPAPAGSKLVLDPFAGSGSTLVAAERLGHKGIGLEIVPEFAALARRRLAQACLFAFGGEASKGEMKPGKPSEPGEQGEPDRPGECEARSLASTVYEADARELARLLQPESVDLVITSPPYWNVLSRKRTSDHKETRDYGDEPANLGRIADYRQFLAALGDVFRAVHAVLKPEHYCIVIVMDLRQGSRFYPFHSDLAAVMQEIGFLLDDIIIWDRRQEYNHLRPLGYPSVFRINKVHEYILIFKKPANPWLAPSTPESNPVPASI